MVETTILAISVVLQLAAAVMALRLLRLTGLRWVSLFLAAAVLLMGIRRGITLFGVLADTGAPHPDLATEIVALVISIFMVLGIGSVAPVFVTGRRAARLRQESEEKFQRLADTCSDLVVLHDLRGRIVDANRVACEWLGYSRVELVALGMTDIEPGWSRDDLRDYIGPRDNGVQHEEQRTLRRRDGSDLVVFERGGLIGGRERQLFLAVFHAPPSTPSAA